MPLTINDRCIYVYTSGTTGLPKAANINHYRVHDPMHGFAAVTDATASDRDLRLPAHVPHQRRRDRARHRC